MDDSVMTEEQSELRIIELVAAKICHDIAGPVGAIANGVELLADIANDIDPEIVGLIESSAKQVRRRLQYFRAALGSGSSLPESGKLAAIKNLAGEMFADSKITLDWAPIAPAAESATGRMAGKLLLNLLLIAQDALPRGGTLAIGCAVEGSRLRIRMTGQGPGARLPDDMAQAIGGRISAADTAPKTVLCILARRIVSALGGKLNVSGPANDAVEISAELPAGR